MDPSVGGANGLPMFPSSSDGNDDYQDRSPDSSFSIDDKSSNPSTPRDFSVSPKADELDMHEMDSGCNWPHSGRDHRSRALRLVELHFHNSSIDKLLIASKGTINEESVLIHWIHR